MIPEALLQKAREKGPDKDFQAYARLWPSILTNTFEEWFNGEGRSVFAHVRRVSAGAGEAYKPEYFGVPLTQRQHANTHQYGESYYYPAKWWVEQAIRMLTNWINNVPPPKGADGSKQVYTIHSAGHMRALAEMVEIHFQNPSNKQIKITIETQKRRTNRQNAGMWAAIIADLVAFYSENRKAFAKDVARSCLMYEPDSIVVHEMMKALCNNRKSTATLPVDEHSKYFDRIAMYMMEHHKHEVRMPVNQHGEHNFLT
jgi:hypothetical protein